MNIKWRNENMNPASIIPHSLLLLTILLYELSKLEVTLEDNLENWKDHVGPI